jgi:guanine nucleotide-binding protein alpha-1 subunit
MCISHSAFRSVFMNKCDILQRKIESGIKVNKYMTSYGSRENSVEVFSKCAFPPKTAYMNMFFTCFLLLDIQNKFKEILVTFSPEKRAFYGYMTSVVVRLFRII